jgi:GNAT superfamily N-acetyltransferase
MIDGITLRETTLADVPEIVRHRRYMFDDMAMGEAAARDRMEAASEPYLRDAISRGKYHGCFAITASKEIAGGAGILLQSSPPRPWEIKTQRPYLLNVYVYQAYRRCGIARLLTQMSIDWCRSQGFASVSLHASPFGRPLYESMGFKHTNELRLMLK